MTLFARLSAITRYPLHIRRAAYGVREQPERIVLGVRDGTRPGVKPPVRIFVGTEPAQYRAERVLLWSIEQVRDPSRVYEIYLMKNLAGFDQRRWLTGFTNYRFAIPHFAGGAGRAIYNDVDQVYLADPGELFDTDLGHHGFLSLSVYDTSVMLLDCARMASVWTLAAARGERRKRLEARAGAVPGLWGPLDPRWHARDGEYEAGRTKLLHYTTIHMQPWRPFPRRYAYQRNPVAHVWFDLERAADAAGYQVFTAAHPSAAYTALLNGVTRGDPADRLRSELLSPGRRMEEVIESVQDLIGACGARSILEYGFGERLEEQRLVHALQKRDGRLVVAYADLTAATAGERPAQQYDGVVCVDVITYLPDEDVPWVLEELFAHARQFVYVTVAPRSVPRPFAKSLLLSGQTRDEAWWLTHFAAVSARHPAIHWRLGVHTRTTLGHAEVRVHDGGRRLGSPPTVWVLADDKPGHTSQSVGLAEALGWPYEIKALRFTILNRLSNHLLGASLASVDKARSAPLTPPWPDLVIATGRRLAPVARWVKKQNQGRTRLVHLGRKGGERAELFDLVVSCAHFRLPPHPRRIETVVPLNPVICQKLTQAAERWEALFADAPRPRIALLVGGTSATHRLDAETARRLGEEIQAFARAAGGSLFVTTSPRTGSAATVALRRGLGEVQMFYRWQPGAHDNPYLAFLALADVLVVTGESESMLAEAAASGKPLYIYPLPQRPLGLRARCKDWIVACAQTPRLNQRGTARPQRGWQYVCARLLERGLVQPRRDLNVLHRALVHHGVARFFGEPLTTACTSPLREIDEVAHRVRALMGMGTGA